MAILRCDSFALVGWSANWASPSEAKACLERLSQDRLQSLKDGKPPVAVGTVELSGTRWMAWGHRVANVCIVELEKASWVGALEAPIYELARDVLPQFQRFESLAELLNLAVKEFRRLSGFGRCLIYRFDRDGHGEVLAEDAAADYERFLGHHFPAADIPVQARELYCVNRFRLIPDARYDAVPLIGDSDFQASQLDLSHSFLRSVSPVHLEYMRNMGTLASMSVSIVVDGKLWGLASCHDHEPKPLTPDLRAACSHFGQLLSMQVEAKVANDEIEAKLALRQYTLQMVAHLSDSDATLRGLIDEPTSMLQMARATGAAVVLNDAVWAVGDAPLQEDLLALSEWIHAKNKDVFENDHLAEDFARKGLGETVGGVLCISISRVNRHQIMWFRPEVVRTVTWAGNPSKSALVEETGRIHPRRSFEGWKEQFRGRCQPWTSAEVSAAAELRQALIGIVLKKAEEIAAVADALGRVNKELEAFSYTVSHDLRAPMRHIAGYLDLVATAEDTQVSERSRRYLGHAKEAASYAGLLVDALLDFSRLGRSSLKPRLVDMALLVREVVQEIGLAEPHRRFEWSIDDALPMVEADPVLIQVAVRNLLSNAAKYTRSREVSCIEVRSVQSDGKVGLEVRDNGVGFQMEFVAKLFGVFQRLHRVEEYEGTGIGLANVKRVVERHGGTVWARGEPGKGALFGFSIPSRMEKKDL